MTDNRNWYRVELAKWARANKDPNIIINPKTGNVFIKIEVICASPDA